MAEASHFLQEITEQPAALQAMCEYYAGEGRERLSYWAQEARAAGRVIFTGMGTSEFAPELILAELGQPGIDASTVDAGEWLHYPRFERGMVVLISQSGESVETRKLAEHLFAKGKSLLGVTNAPESTIARVSEQVLLLHAGDETAISTKTYVNTLAVLFLMLQAVKGEDHVQRGLDRLQALAQVMDQVDQAQIEKAAERIADRGAIYFIGRGPAMPAVKQAALTFAEGTRSFTCALTAGAFRHGPFELAGDGHRAVLFIPRGAMQHQLRLMAVEMADLGSHVVAIADHDADLPDRRTAVIRVPDAGEDLFPLAAATAQELLLDAVARRRGVLAGLFRYGEKVTTKE
ncbi:MAG: SIS domain-containing protein [Armatimonadota bacterium]